MIDTACRCLGLIPVPPGNPDNIRCDVKECGNEAKKWCDCRGMALCGESEHPEPMTAREGIEAYVEAQRRWRGNFTDTS